MNLLPKMSLSAVLLVGVTTLTTMFISTNTIRDLVYELNVLFVQKDLTNVHQSIKMSYERFGSLELRKTDKNYHTVINHAQQTFNASHENFKGNLIILNLSSQLIHGKY